MFQIVIVTVVLTLFLYFIFQAGLDKSPNSMLPDFSWLTTRNMSVFIRPEERTSLMEPQPSPCSDSASIRLLVAVYSAPGNDLTTGWKNFKLLSHLNATLAPQARQAQASGENLNYVTLARQARQARPRGEILNYSLSRYSDFSQLCIMISVVSREKFY